MVAMCMARRKPSAKMTFGWKRLEVFGALVSVFIIWILVAALVYEAVLRIFVRLAALVVGAAPGARAGPICCRGALLKRD